MSFIKYLQVNNPRTQGMPCTWNFLWETGETRSDLSGTRIPAPHIDMETREFHVNESKSRETDQALAVRDSKCQTVPRIIIPKYGLA